MKTHTREPGDGDADNGKARIGPDAAPAQMAVVKLFFCQEVQYFGWISDEAMQFLPFETGARFRILSQDAATVSIGYPLLEGCDPDTVAFARSDFEEHFDVVEVTPASAE